MARRQAHDALRRNAAGLEPFETEALSEVLQTLGDQVIDNLSVEVGPDGLTVSERERVYRTTFEELAALWEADVDIKDRSSVLAHMSRWLRSRPVTNEEALRKGVAALTWDAGTDERGWNVYVLRGAVLATWTPTFDTSTDTIKLIQQNAWQRAQSMNHDSRMYGDITVWSSRLHPALSTSLIASRQWLDALQANDLYVVLGQNRAHGVLTCDHDAVTRLHETSRQPLVMYHSSLVPTFRWQ